MHRALRATALLLCVSFAIVFAAGTRADASAGRPFTARDLVMLDRISDPQLSPDGTAVLYDLRSTDFAANRGRHSVWLLDTSGRLPAVRLRVSDDGATNARWSPDGRSIYFLSSRSGSTQVWRTDRTGAVASAVTRLPLDVQTFRIAPDGTHIVVALAVFADCASLACTVQRNAARAARKASGTLYTRVFIRHWDTWADGTRNHLYALALGNDGAPTSSAVSLMRAFDGDTPSKPFGDEHDFAISPDGRTVVFSVRLAGRSEPWSTNFDLWSVPMSGARAPVDLTSSNHAEDVTPVFSPDGRWLAYRAQKRPTFESDRYGVMLRDLRTGATTELAPSWDRSASDIAWSRDGRSIFVSADDVGDHRLFAIDVANGAVKALTSDGAIEGYDVGGKTIVYTRSTLQGPAQLFRVATRGGAATQLTHVDANRLAGVAISPSHRFTFAGWNGDTVHGIVTEPDGYVAGKKYPVAFLIHGGPQGSFGDSWSYRWNPQTYAGRGYAVVTVDFHGSTGYGQAFTDAISQHWGDRPFEDLQKGWDAALAQYPFLDASRACALGASYGGYMIDWIAGNWKAPWKCLVVHDGIFDARMMGYSTEELWFSEWEDGGTVWGHPEGYEQFNPIDHVADWSVPMLVVHSSQDFRVPLEQGIAAFTALQRKGIPSEFLTFSDENHWVLKPQDSLEWHDTVNAWLARWLK